MCILNSNLAKTKNTGMGSFIGLMIGGSVVDGAKVNSKGLVCTTFVPGR